MFDMTLGEVSLAELLRQQVELQQEYGARAARELVLVSKQLMYFERYAKELAPAYNMARDLFLMKNVFPEAGGPAWRPSGASPCPTTRSPIRAATPDDAATAPAAGRAWTTTSSCTARVRAT